MNASDAKVQLDTLIKKARVHFYKPIQIAEVLYKARLNPSLNLLNLEEYRSKSKGWRDSVCNKFIGRSSTSSAKYQDDLFEPDKMSPAILDVLSSENKAHQGVVENYIYNKFFAKHSQMSHALALCDVDCYQQFVLKDFIDSFEKEAGLKRSLDKIYEIVVYALFQAVLDALELKVKLEVNPQKLDILDYFIDFTDHVLGLNRTTICIESIAKVNRVGVTNACDRGLDMWSNFGVAVQIKHLSLTEELAEDIVSTITGDRIVIVCKEAEKKVITSLLGQLGWKSKIQSIITEKDLISWYDLAINGTYSELIGKKTISYMKHEIEAEFPSTDHQEKIDFYTERKYQNKITTGLWVS